MSIAKIANGTLLNFEGTTVPEVMKLSGPSVKFDLLDVTSHDSVGFFREFIPGLADGDKITADVNWRPSNAVHIGLRTNSYARTISTFAVIFPDTSDNTVTMETYIETIVPKADIGTPMLANLSVKVTGEPIWS